MTLSTHDTPYLHLIEGISFQPIFILGLHRSGTSILYKMLAETGCFNTVSTYHILRFDELLSDKITHRQEAERLKLQQLFQDLGITTRKIDHLQITPDFAQEYVYLLTKKSSANKITNKNYVFFDLLCKKIQYISENTKPILVKNPYDFGNFMVLKNLYPSARFIFIHREPVKVIDSTLRAWHTLLSEKNPYTVLFSRQYEKIFENPLYHSLLCWYYSSNIPFGFLGIVHQAKKMTSYYLKHVRYLHQHCYISLRYEDLCLHPNECIRSIMDFLGLPMTVDVHKEIKPREQKLLPIVQQYTPYIKKVLYSYRKYNNYLS
ncbi:MAG: sulfotransferase [Candidatus Thermoplasmatota archaeon]